MSLGIGSDLHTMAYMETLLSVLNSKAGKEAFLANLKKGAVVTGSAVLGTLFLGGVGLVIGGVVGGDAAKKMTGHSKAYSNMLEFLRDMDKYKKHTLVTLVEDLVGDTDTDALVAFSKDKLNRDRLLNCVYNFLSDQFGYEAQGQKGNISQDDAGVLQMEDV